MALVSGWERLFTAAFDRSTNAMELLGEDRRREAVNDAYCALAGRSREELIGTVLEEFIAKEYVLGIGAAWQEFLRSGEWLGGWAIVRPDGTRVRVEIAGVLADVEAGRRALFVCLKAEPEDGGNGVSPDVAGAELTDRELEVVTLIARGRTSPQIADHLVIAPTTVRAHVRNAMGKLGARTRAHLVAIVLTDRAVLSSSARVPVRTSSRSS